MTTPEEHQDGSSQPTNVPAGGPARGTSTPDPARVAAYAKAIYAEGAFCGDCSYEGWDECSACRRWCLIYASAATAVTDGEQEALRAENERLTDDRRRAYADAKYAEDCARTALDRAEAAEAKVRAVELALAERMALTVAVVQVSRGESPSPNVAAVCVMALDRICAALADVPAEPREPEVDSCYCPDDHASWCPNLTPVVTPPADDEGGA